MNKMLRLLVVAILVILVTGALGCGLNTPAPKPEVKQVADGVTIEGQAVGGLTAPELGKLVNELAKTKHVPAVNASFDPLSGAVVAGTPGQQLHVVQTINQLLTALPGSAVLPVYVPELPDITHDKLANAKQLGGYTTPILDNSTGRLTNIRLTAKLVNNRLLTPGTEFSFNQTVGDPTDARGFQQATVFENGQKVQGLGGGMCQVSSTLYNAVLAAGLRVLERHPHSLPVNYVLPGKDATTATDKDLRFINSTRLRVLTRAFIHDNDSKLTVDLWALPDA